jgi:hypothetical protein
VLTVAFCAVCFVGGFGLLRRKLWGFWLAVGYQLFAVVNGTFSLLSPERPVLIKEITASYELRTHQYLLPNQFFDAIAILSLLVAAIFLMILLYYRPRLLVDNSNISAQTT